MKAKIGDILESNITGKILRRKVQKISKTVNAMIVDIDTGPKYHVYSDEILNIYTKKDHPEEFL